MSPEEIRNILRGVLAEQRSAHESAFNETIVKSVAAILTSFGIVEEDRKEIRADLTHLRMWRRSVEHAQIYTFKALITISATGLFGAAWIGFKTMLAK